MSALATSGVSLDVAFVLAKTADIKKWFSPGLAIIRAHAAKKGTRLSSRRKGGTQNVAFGGPGEFIIKPHGNKRVPEQPGRTVKKQLASHRRYRHSGLGQLPQSSAGKVLRKELRAEDVQKSTNK
jgi:hypothetical protein